MHIDHERLEAGHLLKDYEYFANISNVNKNLETVEMEFKP